MIQSLNIQTQVLPEHKIEISTPTLSVGENIDILVIILPNSQPNKLSEIANKTGKTQGEIIEFALTNYLHFGYAQCKDQFVSLPPSIGMGNSGMGNLSEQCEELLWQFDLIK